MASNPPGQCCVANFQHDGVPKGQLGKIDESTLLAQQEHFAYLRHGLTTFMINASTVLILTDNVYIVSTYFAYPDAGTDTATFSDTAIVFITDILGIYINAKLQADLFAKAMKCTVVMPDLFNGDSIDADAFLKGSVDLKPFLEKHTVETIDSVIERTIKYLEEEKQIKKIGAVGYCFGGKVYI